ncbi:MAG: flagellar filament capping protein FliD [Planctomycetota bacterium]|nr:flagellar filament capping protein FliD [Planctomycetota bacterium]
MSSSISFGGLASGLDTTAIINALVAAEEIPILSVESKKEAEEAKLSKIGNLESLIKQLETSAKGLTSLGDFLSYGITPSEEGVAKFTVTGAPISGSHSLMVKSLATADRWSTAPVADDSSSLGFGTISFDYDGQSYTVAIDPINSNINDIAAAINSQANGEVVASVVNTGTESTPAYEMVLSGTQTGADYAITSLTSTVAGLQFDLQPMTAASDAVIVLDGQEINRSTNEFTDVLGGITIEAIAADLNKTISFGISVDTEGIETKLEEFISNYNDVMNFITEQSAYSVDDGVGGVLFGDSLLQSVKSKLYNGFVAVDPQTVQDDTEGYSALSLLGIKSTVDGTLEIDSAKLNEKMAGNIELFSSFFTGSADGTTPGAFANLETQLATLTESMGDDADGNPLESLFKLRKETLGSKISDYEDTILDMEYRLDKYQEGLVTKYAALEVLMAQLQVQEAAAVNLANLNF